MGERTMMDEIFSEFSEQNKLIERDPIVLGERLVRHTCERILPPDLPADLLKNGLPQRLAAVSGRMKDCIERGRGFLIFESVIPDFTQGLLDWMTFERKPGGALYVVTNADEVGRLAHAGLWQNFCWNGHHTHTLVECLEQDDLPLKSVDFDEIETSKRTISRESEFWDLLRPNGTSKEFWAARGVSAAVVQLAKDRERHEERERNRPQWNASPDSMAGPNVRPR